MPHRHLNYTRPGATRLPHPPRGFTPTRRANVLGHGREFFTQAATALMAWELHHRAGLRVHPTTPHAEEGAEVLLTLGIGPLAIPAPCRVVYTIDEPRRQGYAYGTLDGHPEQGEELFCLHHLPDDRVVLTITAFSRPTLWWSRLGAPVSRLVQKSITERYLRVLEG
ncbi:DUF1990 domain-containing protein [Spiractinospora alimapuensis]|uniref:DUF1990 family protein n=1 Tax=Spiractinospora alimapuensis TaxID=2820884 RepID=UPI001F1CA361|nr:DUF1990 domain-containing protein [Spiractinospora alimapuensis]QVQ53790.1 DUF1990 domain-containing protein [Spiractinospora alimapuensis]